MEWVEAWFLAHGVVLRATQVPLGQTGRVKGRSLLLKLMITQVRDELVRKRDEERAGCGGTGSGVGSNLGSKE